MRSPSPSADPGPARDSDAALAEQLLRLNRRLHRLQRHQFGPLGITPAQSRLLRAVTVFAEPPRMADLAARLDVVPRAITTLVDALEASDRVRRVPDPGNRRVTRIELTDEGRETLEALRRARREAAQEVLSPLAPGQRAQLGELLELLVSAGPMDAHGHCAHPPRTSGREGEGRE
ncbi:MULTISPECIES: MarR family winged helix-turn-helix transcriptional regulator [unclassified Streptomyces]|uniref:MarR family winged helix-turn-helix transcriptional regulator n=1 Tax=unclassified Streptomyces TaxID=2593676 RepID=UPI0001B579DA|nr:MULTISPECIES: MarR family transcriptional regulator [unclassified Streptomyces]EFL04051.1 MarR family transcriptional regulator [Streptomyces sp. SPB78]MYR26350.1 MarR family transcriptional regulator [Streptomyces sp. SID4945]NJA55957.1 MarR family transcriptional regulator [Streptomyces sp. NEAU-H3]SCD77276.1 DNA-binding transcriptional regulator, MarR family [Streptomyces sp. TverLS-915]SCF01042.1 DNA-binding transcriptional regulator, MarR family [Streptomyces sp. LcepLS]